MTDQRQAGLVAVGDSIVNGFNQPLAKVPPMGFGQHVAQALDLAYTRYARGGITTAEIAERHVSRVVHRYEIGVVACGTNDVYQRRSVDEFRSNARTILGHLAANCERVAVLTIPASETATAILKSTADEYENVLAVDATLVGPRLLRGDCVHPTSVGQLELADRVAAALGMPLPSQANGYPRPGRLEPTYVLGYGCRLLSTRAKQVAKRALGRRPELTKGR